MQIYIRMQAKYHSNEEKEDREFFKTRIWPMCSRIYIITLIKIQSRIFSHAHRRCMHVCSLCLYTKSRAEIWVMWADRLAFSHSERIWPGIGPRSVDGPKKSPQVITALVLRPWYRFLPHKQRALGLLAYTFCPSFPFCCSSVLSHFFSPLNTNLAPSIQYHLPLFFVILSIFMPWSHFPYVMLCLLYVLIRK